jgi:hypothetical protein
MKRRKREVDIFNMSFLDVISCGFGAVILLLVISLAYEPSNIENISKDLSGLISEKKKNRESMVKNSHDLSKSLASKKKALTSLAVQLTELQKSLNNLKKRHSADQASTQEQSQIEQQLKIVRQQLSNEMKRLLSQPDYRPPKESASIGGIPVDSEYIVFIIDTSGSMRRGAWPLVIKKIKEILSVYPKVKGIQVMNDMGVYMFNTYRGQWIPDTPSRRTAIINRLHTWHSFSNSSPVEGIYHAVRTFYRPDRPTSFYIFGDDFNGTSIEDVIKTVSRVNRKNSAGRSQVRIHTFGFPVYALLINQPEKFTRFAHLMRLLAEQNSGSFVGLTSLR